jgi:hypothetical protein
MLKMNAAAIIVAVLVAFEVLVQLRWAMKNALVAAPPFGSRASHVFHHPG